MGTEAEQAAAWRHEQLMNRNEHNDNMLQRVANGQRSLLAEAKEKVKDDVTDDVTEDKFEFGPLSSMNIMTQWKVAQFLRDNDEFKSSDWSIIDNQPDPTYGDVEKYYYLQQRVLRGDRIPKELDWMKKLKTSLWKGLKPDPISVDANFPIS